MEKSSKARETFNKGFNCAQSVLHTFGKQYFKESSHALKLASGFGAGISFRGEMCGAVTGSFMIIGLHYGFSDPNSDLSREITYKIIKEFSDEFEKKNESLICNKILNTDMRTVEGIEFARENNLFKTVCPKMVETAADIINSLFIKYPPEKLK